MAMAGRRDFSAWRAATTWNHGAQSVGPAVCRPNAIRNILDGRNAIITSDEKRELATCAHRNLPGRSREFRPIGPSATIALSGACLGIYRFDGNSSNNLIPERCRKGFNWPKWRNRLILDRPDEGLGETVIPDAGDIDEEDDKEELGEHPPRMYPSRRGASAFDEPHL